LSTDHFVVFGERHLRHILLSYMKYNDVRTHLSLEKDSRSCAPSSGPGAFFSVQFSADCATNMSGLDLRQARLFSTVSVDSELADRSLG
jgi:hypothetical protein